MMKSVTIVAGILLALTACRKFDPGISEAIKPPKPILVRDTIPDKGFVKIKLMADSVNYDETELMFNHEANAAYNPYEDAAYLQGFGQVNLATISADGRDLAISQLPYRAGMSVSLDVRTRNNGKFSLKLSYENKIPEGVRIWLKDAFKNDSTDMCRNGYSFDVSKADTNSFGSRRFRLVFGR